MERGLGWILFAWTMLLVAGLMRIINGIAALTRPAFFHGAGAHYIFSDLKVWGWVALVVGVIEIAAAVGVWRGSQFGRVAGIAVAAIALVVWMFWVPIVPFWAIVLMVMDVLIIYGLALYGGQGSRDEA
jgi:hypothetical protein